MGVSADLLDILVCPDDKSELLYFEDEACLYNSRLKRKYEVRNGSIPVLLIDEATTADDGEHRRLMAKADAGDAFKTGQRNL